MGYDVHITRKPNWYDTQGPAISFEEWLAYVKQDSEMRLESFAEASLEDGVTIRIESDGLSVWNQYSGHETDGNKAWFDYRDGTISVKNPDPEILRKMWTIAQALSAKVQGDDDELYGPSGEVIPEPETESTHALNKTTWWSRWRDWFRT